MPKKRRLIAIACGLFSITLPSLILSPVQAQTPAQTELSQTEFPQTELLQTELGIRFNPPNRGAPGSASTSDAGSRSCGLMVFGPAQSHWGETLQPNPSFWLYASNPGSVAFDLTVEETSEIVHQGTFEITEGQTLTRHSLPTSSLPLVIDQAYRWAFTLDCPGDPDPAANGIIVRRAPSDSGESETVESESVDLAEQPAGLTQLTQARTLAAEGFWFDAIETLNQLRLAEAITDHPAAEPQIDLQTIPEMEPPTALETETQTAPSSATQDWQSLLEQGGWRELLGDQFEQVTAAPFSSSLLSGSSEIDTQETCAEESSSEDKEACIEDTSSPAIEPASEVNQ